MKPKSLMEVYEAAKAGKVVVFKGYACASLNSLNQLQWSSGLLAPFTPDTLDPDNWEIEELPYQHPTRFEVGQVWEKEGESDREVVVVGKNGIALFFWMDRLTAKALGDTADIEFCLAKGWKLKEGA